MISGLSGTNYEEKLTELNMKTLEQRRIQLDLIQTYKIIHGVDKVNCSDFFNLVDISRPCSTRLSSCPFNIQLKKAKTTTFQNFYTNRVINLWNKLPNDVKEIPTVFLFRNKIKDII